MRSADCADVRALGSPAIGTRRVRFGVPASAKALEAIASGVAIATAVVSQDFILMRWRLIPGFLRPIWGFRTS
jgi:hypothetical protein